MVNLGAMPLGMRPAVYAIILVSVFFDKIKKMMVTD